MNGKTYEIGRIEILADKIFINSVLGFVKSVLECQNLDENDIKKLLLSTEEACLNVVEHAYEWGEKGKYSVFVNEKADKIVIGVEDKGLPIDFADIDKSDKKGLGMTLMKGFADEIKIMNLGKNGKRIEIIKNKKFTHITEINEDKMISEDIPRADDVPILKMMEETDVIKLSRCVYRSYGYSYAGEALYYPEKIISLMKDGLLKSCVAISKDGEVVGHLALIFDSPGELIAETGQAVVDPRYRGHKLFEKMKLFLVEKFKNNMKGFYSESVTIHPYTQRGNISIGAHETGFQLGYIPHELNFRNIGETKKDRQTAAIFYLKINNDEKKRIFVPDRHIDIIKAIYKRADIDRDFYKGYENAEISHSVISVEIKKDWGQGYIKVIKYGEDFLNHVRYRLRELILKNVICIYIDLPLDKAHADNYYEELEKMGFFFSAIYPCAAKGDILRYQFINSEKLDKNQIIIFSDFGKKLFEYVWREYENSNNYLEG